jgi:hypothetical protein
VHVTEGSTSNTRRVREAGHASHKKERLRRLQEECGVPPRHGGARGRRAVVEPDVEHQPELQQYMDMEQEQPDVELQHMEEQELEEELQAMEEEMEDVEPQRRRKKKVVDTEPLDDYPGSPHETGLLWRYHVHVARKAADGEVFISVKLTYFISEIACLCTVKSTCLFTVIFVCEAMSLNSLY